MQNKKESDVCNLCCLCSIFEEGFFMEPIRELGSLKLTYHEDSLCTIKFISQKQSITQVEIETNQQQSLKKEANRRVLAQGARYLPTCQLPVYLELSI